MTAPEALERLLAAYTDYYNIERIHPAAPFAAEAAFHSHAEQYFLLRAARLAESESHEYVFFALADRLTPDLLREYAAAAWETGTGRASPHASHRNTDVALIALADRVDAAALELAPKLRYYRSYRFSLHGWSHFALIAAEVSTGRCAWNRQGRRLRDTVLSNIRKP